MSKIPDMSLETARDKLGAEFLRRIDGGDFKHPKCIWCKAGGTNNKKNNHSLMDCPTAYPLDNNRTQLSADVLGAGKEDAAAAYIHQKQLLVYPRHDNATTFSAQLPRSQMARYTVPVPTTLAPPLTPHPTTSAPPLPHPLTPHPAPLGLSTPYAPSVPSHNPITPVTSPQPPASSASQRVPSSVPPTSIGQASSGFASSLPVPTTGSTSAATAQIEPTVVSQSLVSSAVASVNLQDAPTINFKEVASSHTRPEASSNKDGNSVLVDNKLVEKLSHLEDTSKYPLRTSLRVGPNKNTVITNYFQMNINPNATFYEYRIKGIPASESRAGKKRYMETAIQNIPFLHQNTGSFATDNIETIISWENLHEQITSEQVSHGDPVTRAGGEWRLVDIIDRDTKTRLDFCYSGQIDIAGLLSYANTMNTDPTAYNPSSAETALNIIMAKCIANNNTLHLNNHKFYVRDAGQDLKTYGQGNIAPLRALRGYSYRVHPGMGSILLNMSPANSAFWRPLMVSEVLLHGRGPFGGTTEDVTRALRNVRVYVVYNRDSKDKRCKHLNCTDRNCRANDRAGMVSMDVQHARLKTVRGFGRKCNQQTFPWEHKDARGNAIAGATTNPTVQQYQFAQYRQQLKHPGLPAVNVGTTLKPTWFAPEHLRIVPDQIYAKIIPDGVANNFHREACQRPAEIRSRIEQEGLRHIPIDAETHILNTTFLHRNTANVSWKLILEPGIWNDSATRLIDNFNLQLRNTGVSVNPQHEGAPLVLPETTEFRLRNTIRTYLKEPKTKVPDIFVLLMKDKNQKLYSSFKYLTDKVFVLQSICMTLNSMRGGGIAQYMANVAMKANLKMAGINHSAAGVDTWLDKTLVLGADCTHPGSGALKGSPSVAAVVGSLEANGGRFRGKLKLHPGKQEIIYDLENFLLDHFTDWYTHHQGKFPENVLYYRDGLAGIEKAFDNLVKAKGGENIPKLKITAIIVTKRHSTRFFPHKKSDEMNNGNCKPGLLVDSVITSPYYADFYLQSHNGIKGTARSAHYTVIRNDMTMTTNELEDLTHRLNHTYVRATLGVSYAAPAYYADRLCERARCYLREWYNPDTDKRQHYHNKLVDTERTVEQRRNNINANMPARTRGHKKTEADIKAEKDDVEDIENSMRTWLRPQYEARWDAQPDDAIPDVEGRKRRFEQTMYWM
ncbi:hypothetical protein ACET3X_002396 [Alternaria dauci]|uniref:Piwi domain-containing protein n=1 Tax=Alternaria dauci TaxID=48095 RepID=A0ABR3URB5_9PLEO